MLKSYCYKCHDSEVMKGDVDLSTFTSKSQMLEDREFWRLAKELIEEEEMPSKAPFPTDEEREEMIEWIDAVVNDRDWFADPHPGHGRTHPRPAGRARSAEQPANISRSRSGRTAALPKPRRGRDQGCRLPCPLG